MNQEDGSGNVRLNDGLGIIHINDSSRRGPNMPYSSHLRREAETFTSYSQADMFAYHGFAPVNDGGKWRLRNTNGEYISDILLWWDHDAAAEKSYLDKLRTH